MTVFVTDPVPGSVLGDRTKTFRGTVETHFSELINGNKEKERKGIEKVFL